MIPKPAFVTPYPRFLCLLVTTLLLLVVGRASSSAPDIAKEVWELNLLCASCEGVVPPSHTLTLHKGQGNDDDALHVEVAPIRYNSFYQLVFYFGEMLGLTARFASSYEAHSAACPLPVSVREWRFSGVWRLTATQDGATLPGLYASSDSDGDCLLPLFPLPLVRDVGTPILITFPKPISIAADAGCEPLPWQAVGVSGHRLSPEQMVTVLSLSRSEDASAQCDIPLEWVRRSEAEGRSSLTTSVIFPMVLLVAVFFIKNNLLARKLRGGAGEEVPGRHILTDERRAALLRQQDEIIKKMKAQDGMHDGS